MKFLLLILFVHICAYLQPLNLSRPPAVATVAIARTAQKEMAQAAAIAEGLRAAAFSGGAYVALHMRAGGSVFMVDEAQVWERLNYCFREV